MKGWEGSRPEGSGTDGQTEDRGGAGSGGGSACEWQGFGCHNTLPLGMPVSGMIVGNFTRRRYKKGMFEFSGAPCMHKTLAEGV